MKKIIFSLSIACLMTSCIVIKVYDTPKNEEEQPEVTATKRMMLPSDRSIPLPTGEKKILFFGEDFPPSPEVFHVEIEDSLAGKIVGDSINHKGVFIFKVDQADSLPNGMKFKWRSKAPMHHSTPHKMMKACCMMSPEDCAKKDSVCVPMIGEAEGGEDEKAPLIIIDGEEKAAGFELQAIFPDRIERIDVLKDQTTFNKVGEKGANAVIVITMKKE
jgi:hypothetical protein